MSILGIDYWEKKVWLAIEIENIAFSYAIIDRVKIIKELKKIIKEKNIKTIVIWEPFDFYWQENKTLLKVQKFKKNLQELFPDLKIESIDERFTTKIVDNSKNKRDDLSAVVILQDYLDRKKK